MDETDYWRRLYEHEAERVQNVVDIAARGLVSPVAWRVIKGGMGEPIEFMCYACGTHAKASGACQNPKCVPGEVLRALQKETRIARLNRERDADAAPPDGTRGPTEP